MPELPVGTVTFLFSDIEGSTRLVRADPSGWPTQLERHRVLVRSAITARGGVEVGTEGDSFFVAFPTADGAVSAAADVQRALADEPSEAGGELRVRIGIHTGEAVVANGTYVGLDVHRASRIAGVAHGGQTVVSDVTRLLVERALPSGAALRDLGVHRLKDLDGTERLWQVVIPGLPTDFPPLSSLAAIPNNLPTPLTSFLGRRRELEQVGALVGSSRLVTLTGPGGTGKTRISLEVARQSMTAFEAGVFFVELATIREPDLVVPTIARALGLADLGGRSPIDRLADKIGPGRMLLVLDNLEQILDAAPLIVRLLAACPALHVLASSRSALRVSGEREYPVPPLAVPDRARLPATDQLLAMESVALFVDRARAVRPDFALTDVNASAVAEICVRLDGLPLAIELAAARLRMLTPQAMLARLDDRLGLLSAGARDLPERQQTLRGAIAWSHEMLDDGDRALFACLSVFVGGVRLEDVESVCAESAPGDVLGSLESLVEKSLVRQGDGVDGQPRFTMLETIREYAIEQAAARGVTEALCGRHGDRFTGLALEAEPHLLGSDKRRWLDRLEEEHGNLRAAMSWAIERGRAATALRLGSALWRFWQMRGHLAEGLERLEAALALPDGAQHPEHRAAALSAAAGLAYWQGTELRAREFYAEEVAARRALGDQRGLAEALYGMSFTWTILNVTDDETAKHATALIDDALVLFTELGDEGGIARCHWALANAAYGAGRIEQARHNAHLALGVLERLDDRFMVGWVTYTLALADLSDDVKQPSADRERLLASAEGWLTRALRVFGEAQDVTGYTLTFDAMALLAARRGASRRAARLSGAVARLEQTSGTGLNVWNRGALDWNPAYLRDDPATRDAWADGARMTVEETLAYALRPEPEPA